MMDELMAEGISYPVSRPVSPDKHRTGVNEHVRAGSRGTTVTRRFSSLSPAQPAVRSAITKHGQLTASQVRRLLYAGSPEGVRVRSQRHLKRLTDLGLIRRFWSVYDGPAEYIYMPAGSTTRWPVFHTLDISELYVRLMETMPTSMSHLVFDREPWCHIKIGHVEVKPDAFLKFNEREQYFVEVDRSAADRTKLSKKLRQYVDLFEQWDVEIDGETFPPVIYTVPDNDRRRVIESVAKTQRYKLFKVLLFHEAVDQLTKG
jgi:hypothetical protein